MGASESTARTNGTNPNNHDDDEPNQNINPLGAAAAVAAAGVAAWGISKMLSDNNTETQENQNAMQMNTRTCYLPNSSSSSHITIPRSVSRGPYKMNTDGSCRSIPGEPQMRGPSGFGGVLRDNRGEWVQGFRGFIGVSDCLTAEFHGIYYGLLLLAKLGYRGSVLESDSSAAIEWIKKDSYRLNRPLIKECWGLISECKRLVHENEIDIKCISRDDNKCADKLAFMAIEKQDKFVEIYDRPNEIKQIVY
ncbi:polynucleotidyl transferase, ribonuclease H-like superfamily protein 1 [Tanacetum coccineum]